MPKRWLEQKLLPTTSWNGLKLIRAPSCHIWTAITEHFGSFRYSEIFASVVDLNSMLILSQQPIVRLKSGRFRSLVHSKSNAFREPWTPSKSVAPFTHICPPFPYP